MPDPQQLPSTRLGARGLGLIRALSRKLKRQDKTNYSESATVKETPKDNSSSENKENTEIEKRLQDTDDHPPQLKKKQVHKFP